jgi:hypothetical protein
MADELRMALAEVLRKAGVQEADFLREGVRVLAQELMELDLLPRRPRAAWAPVTRRRGRLDIHVKQISAQAVRGAITRDVRLHSCIGSSTNHPGHECPERRSPCRRT